MRGDADPGHPRAQVHQGRQPFPDGCVAEAADGHCLVLWGKSINDIGPFGASSLQHVVGIVSLSMLTATRVPVFRAFSYGTSGGVPNTSWDPVQWNQIGTTRGVPSVQTYPSRAGAGEWSNCWATGSWSSCRVPCSVVTAFDSFLCGGNAFCLRELRPSHGRRSACSATVTPPAHRLHTGLTIDGASRVAGTSEPVAQDQPRRVTHPPRQDGSATSSSRRVPCQPKRN